MKATMLLLSLPIAAALAFAPRSNLQDPQGGQEPGQGEPAEVVAITPLSEMQYVDLQGKTTVVSARNVVEIRVFEDDGEYVRIELLYENGDYSLLTAQGLHLLRNGGSTRDVRLVRGERSGMRFPRLP